MNLQAVIFDLDGTLIDSMGVWEEVDREFLKKRGIKAPDNLFDDVIGGNSFPEIAQHFKNKFHLPESIEDIMLEWTNMVKEHYEKSVRLKPHVLQTLQMLSRNQIKMGIGTSNSPELTRRVLRSNQVDLFFSAIVNGGETCRGKPYPDIFLKVAEKLEVKPENCIVVEDVWVGIQAAKKAGIRVLAIEDSFAKKESEKIKADADFYFSDFKAIYEYLKKLREKKR